MKSELTIDYLIKCSYLEIYNEQIIDLVIFFHCKNYHKNLLFYKLSCYITDTFFSNIPIVSAISMKI